jgi:carbamoyltransferase
MILHEGRHYYLHRTNSLGMRSDREYPSKRPIGRRRIALFGDSYTAGLGVTNRDRFSDLLEHAHPNLDVMNFGLSGSGTDQQLLIYETLAKPFEADAYILAPYFSDIQRIVTDVCQFGSRTRVGGINVVDVFFRHKPYFTLDGGHLVLHNQPVSKDIIPDKETSARLGAAGERTLAYEKIYPLMPQWMRRNAVTSIVSRALMGDAQESFESETSPSWQLMRAIIERFKRQVRGKPTFIVPLPSNSHFVRNLKPTYLARYANLHDPAENCYVVDVLPYFERLPREKRAECIFVDDVHYTPLGHRVVAEAIDDALAEYCPAILSLARLEAC